MGGIWASATGGVEAFCLFCMQMLETPSGAFWSGLESRECLGAHVSHYMAQDGRTAMN